MYHTPFLILQSQLSDQKKAKLIVEGIEVFFQALDDEGVWVIKAKLYIPPESLSDSLKETLSSLDHIKASQGVRLKAYPEEGFVILTHITKASESFMHFKGLMKDFMSNYDLWKSVVDDMVRSEGILLT